ncbi:MAG TPA: hypothetical protein VF466_00040 [Candidatus Saccharimonadales bacterium]
MSKIRASQKTNRQQGFGHIGLLVAVVVLVGVFMVGLQIRRNYHHASVSGQLKRALANADCSGQSDTNLCKFFISNAAQKYTSVSFTDYTTGRGTTGTYQTDNASKYHIATKSSAGSYEVIGIDTTLYSKDPDGGPWWKEQVRRSDLVKYNRTTGSGLSFAATANGMPVTYRKQDSLPCPTAAHLTCLKYQVADPSLPGVTRFIWFDTQYFQLQRVKTIENQGVSDATFGYGDTDIKAPSDSKALPANQYIVPGQSDPVTVPEGGVTGDVGNLLN